VANIKQGTARNRSFLMVSSKDNVSPAKGLRVLVELSKDGDIFRVAEGKTTEISRGWYKVALTPNDTSTLGDLSYECSASGAVPTSFQDQVVAE
jgi:hypothetical protein